MTAARGATAQTAQAVQIEAKLRAAGRASGGDAEDARERLADGRGTFGDADAGGLQGGDLPFRAAFAAADDRAGVAHAAPRRRGAAGDERNDRLADVLLHERRR